MAAQLKRHLGFYAVVTVSIGAMVGSGIFVLPGLAFKVGGPSMILAYFIAGLIVFPAALAMSEMSTAIPRAGGTYLFIDLSMGPMMGTIAGFGVWFSLVFKAAFALTGLGLYVGLFADLDPLVMGLVIGAALVALNLVGIKESGRAQAILVTFVVAMLLVFIGGGATFVDSANFHPFFPAGTAGLFETAAIIFVSYAGVTKVASIAEEVSNPYRILPIAMIGSLLMMMFVYPAVTYVIVGVTPPETLAGDLTPLATASAEIFPEWVVTLVAVVGVLALASMANAGLLASSRYPFAMARRKLAPSLFSRVGEKSGTPTASVILTGVLLLALVAFVPVFELAKLASAFQLLILAMVSLAQIAFRSSKLWWYKPRFVGPGYPWVPIAGIIASLALITQLGAVPILGALGIIVAGLVWYQVYGRSRAIKESAFRESVRQQGRQRLLQLTEKGLVDESRKVAVIADDNGYADTLLRVGRSLSGSDADSELIRFLQPGAGLEARVSEADPDLIVSLLGDGDLPVDRDVVAFSGEPLGDTNVIAVLGSGGPYDVLKISLAARLAEREGATVRFVHVLDPASSRAQVRFIQQFHSDVGELCNVPTESRVIESVDLLSALTSAVGDADLAIIGAPTGRHFFNELFDRIVERIEPPVLVVRVADRDSPTTLRSFFDRLVTSRLSQSDATHDG